MSESEQDPTQAPQDSHLNRSVEELRGVAVGIAGKLLGRRVVKDYDPDVLVISEEADRAIEQIGDTLGQLFQSAGDGLQESVRRRHGADPDAPEASRSEPDDAQRGDADAPDPSKETSLLRGMRALARGLGAVAGEVLEEISEFEASVDGRDDADRPDEGPASEPPQAEPLEAETLDREGHAPGATPREL